MKLVELMVDEKGYAMGDNVGLRDGLYGAAVGDALGVPFEFCGRQSCSCMGMSSGGFHGKTVGIWSDDTSMMLATADSIREMGRIDSGDILSRFRDWIRYGKYAIDSDVFDVGITVSSALARGQGLDGERDNGNGSLMRILPLAFTNATEAEIREVSAITHAHHIACDACVCYVGIARSLIRGADVRNAIQQNLPSSSEFQRLGHLDELGEDDISSGGYVVHTIEAALWCLLGTDDYRSCVLKAVNLGGDTDTTACVAGGLAGIVYGEAGIPAEWMQVLKGKDIIESCLF